MTFEVRQGDARAVLATLPAASVQCVVTSPPYWGLRAYGTAPQVWGGDPACKHAWDEQETREVTGGGENRGNAGSFVPVGACGACGACGAWRGEFGLEPTPELYVEHAVELFREVRRVLRDDGTLWLNLGDSYAAGPLTLRELAGERSGGTLNGRFGHADNVAAAQRRAPVPPGLKPKDLVGIPWRVAFALQADGWWLRSDIIWAKPNPMPESIRDRPTKAHEYLFLLTKAERYYYDADAIKTESDRAGEIAGTGAKSLSRGSARGANVEPSGNAKAGGFCISPERANRRSVWTIPAEPYADAHFAVMPQALVEPCVLAGSRPGDLVVDTCCGSGTVGVVALRHGRRFLGSELNPEYCAMARRRIAGPLFAEPAGASA